MRIKKELSEIKSKTARFERHKGLKGEGQEIAEENRIKDTRMQNARKEGGKREDGSSGTRYWLAGIPERKRKWNSERGVMKISPNRSR